MFSGQVRRAVFWRSGSQIVAQIVMWGSTLAVIRILNPQDYGLFAMTQVILVLFNFLNGYGFASALIQSESLEQNRVRQAFGMLILLNAGLAILQLGAASIVAAYYRQPEIVSLLRVQALLYLATPFIALPDALLSRALDFRNQAKANLAAAMAGALTALGCALAGLGVWTLVFAPIALFYTRAICLTLASRMLVRPSFDFRGASTMFGFGGALLVANLFWTIQSQADIFIGGRVLDPHALGLYAEALFLTQIFVNKFVPPLNEVAFPAYSRLQNDSAAFAWSFLKAVRIIMLAAVPIYFGLAVSAEPAVLVLFGRKWIEIVPLVQILAFAMPFMTLHVLLAPALNAKGQPGLTARIAIIGAAIMVIAFLVGSRFGVAGLAWAWLFGFPVTTLAACALALPVIGARWRDLARAVAPGLIAAAGMALVAWAGDSMLPPLAPLPHLLALIALGGLSYAALLLLFARATLDELLRLVFRRRPAAA
ncbi:lipopolysaccharide biosynthesis protein [Sphingomonas cavernae]|uniref:Lipopolysaccharide biosynthesis protein n=1 Tax=Sphingomonas cavernae TaxID=2320861 RepID=A0A418WSH1_9SPHN|nr:lipopolysaccharide biosynthesis protein [Sphingomonas cavernae]RJF94136.1 lipopolysaccharide biosynthesis protein [Sphingomonas cavernae]